VRERGGPCPIVRGEGKAMWSTRLVGGYTCLGSISQRLLYALAPALLLVALGCGERLAKPLGVGTQAGIPANQA